MEESGRAAKIGSEGRRNRENVGAKWRGEREREGYYGEDKESEPKCEEEEDEEEMLRWDLVPAGSLVSAIFDLNVLWHFSSRLLRCN